MASNFYAQKLTGVLYPSYIVKNNTFEVSFIGTTGSNDYESILLYLLVDEEVTLNKAVFTTGNNYIDLEIKKDNYKDFENKTYCISLDKSVYEVPLNSPYQILVSLQANGISATQILYALECHKGNKTFLVGSSFTDNSSLKVPSKLNLSFYNKDDNAGKCIQIKNKGSFSFSVPEEVYNFNTMVEFWAKINIKDGNWFEIKNEENNSTIFSMGSNSFQMLNISMPNDNLFYDDYFISKNAWYHFNVFINDKTKKAKIYIDDKLFYTFPINLYTTLSSLTFTFTNSADKRNVLIDALKVWDFNNTPSVSFFNKHYERYSADSSILFFELLFDETNIFQKYISSSKFDFTTKNTELIESDAPIFSTAPVLNINVFGGYNSVEWVTFDNNSEIFVLEKSENGSFFEEIYRTDSENDLTKTYYFTDSKNVGSQIIYYRVKQINADESIVYSNQIKVGVSEKKTFDIVQNYPNPFNPKTSITIEIYESTYIELAVYNIVGKEISTLHKGTLPVGEYSFEFNAIGLPSGIYFCKVTNGDYVKVQKMILTK
ncbi:MAG: T9SS type A sorting domain-containing protein [bacterium]